MASSKTESRSRWFAWIFEEPAGWPANGLLFLLAATCFTLSFVRGYSGWMTAGWFFSVLAVAESVPAERAVLAGAVRIGGVGLVLLAALAIDTGLVA
ncbi:hypothetical protein [Natronococcus sp. A-GB7]|uniref:hypothetical protein n=1 Tax=Natronococcus sp. A-GB7 TaxID=3037649 RepID=UPI00241D2EA9|nr:hypothetical protein [Natronococcus sp. A-GB7]MDG5817268.1 hypothetical protein [Natronococcus sp. A-GB7]